jgi:two-component system, cell cycle sensor histidine kinase and response regulator CckA
LSSPNNQTDVHSLDKNPVGRKKEHHKMPDWKDNDIFCATFYRAGIGMAVTDLYGRIMGSNPALQKMLGYRADEIEGMAFTEITHPDDVQMDFALAQELFSCKRETYCLEKRYIRKDGGLIWGKLTASLVLAQDGKPRFGIGMVEDITKAKQTEESLKKSQRRMSTLMSNLPGMAYCCKNDPQWTMEFASDGCYSLTGHKSEEMLDNVVSSYAQLIHPEDRQTVYDEVQGAVNARRKFQITYRIKPKNGPEKWVWEMGQGIPGPEGDIIALEGFIADITEQQRTQAELLAKEKRFRELTEMLPEVVFETDMALNLKFANQQAFSMFGYSKEDFEKGLNGFDMVAPQDRQRARKNLENRINIEPWGAIEYQGLKKDGTVFPILLHTNPIFENKLIKGFRGIIVDLTDQKKMEERLRIGQKMESIGRLAGGVAHDFNNKLGVILGNVEMALEEIGDPSHALFDYLSEIQAAARHSTDLTRQLLAYARKQTIAPRVIDINETIQGMLKMLKRLIGENIDLAWLPGMDIWPVNIDPSQVDQVLTNLCVNARDAISGVGKVIIESENISVNAEYSAGHAGFVPGDYVKIEITDNGVGMSRYVKEHLFEPFFTTKGMGKGTGLGLATVYGIVKQNRGFIDVYSEPGKGTSFKIYLPCHKGIAASTRVLGEGTIQAGQNEVVLLVEDEPAILKVAQSMLRKLGYWVLPAATVTEAVRLATEHEGKLDLLITDVIMPEMNGQELSARLQQLHPELKVLYMSGYTADTIAHNGVLDKGINFIQKPFSTRSIADKVREVLKSDT